MRNISEQALGRKVKISLNLNEELADVIKDLAILTKSTQTMIITSLAYHGMNNLFKDLSENWRNIAKENNPKSEKAKELLRKLEVIQKKWKKMH